MNVKDLMTSDVASCHVDTNLQAVALLMWNHDCGAVPVLDAADKPIGMVTDRDLLMSSSLNSRPLWELHAGEVIGSRPLFSCRGEDEVGAALGLMRDQKVRRLPVTDDSERLVGVLSLSNMIQVAQKQSSHSKPAEQLSFDQLVDALKALTAPYTDAQSNTG